MAQKTRSHFDIKVEKPRPIHVFELVGSLVFALTISLVNDKLILVSIGAAMGGITVVGVEDVLAFLQKKLRKSNPTRERKLLLQ